MNIIRQISLLVYKCPTVNRLKEVTKYYLPNMISYYMLINSHNINFVYKSLVQFN